MTSTELATIDRFRAQVEALATVPDALDAADKLAVLQLALKKAGYSQQMQNEAAALKLRAERKAGEIINEVVPESGGGASSGRITLESLGLKPDASRRIRKLARIPADMFDEYLANTFTRGDEITRAGALRLAPVTSRTTVDPVTFVAPTVTDEIAARILGDIGDELAELVSSSLTRGLHELVEQGRDRQAMIWSRYHGITDTGEQGERWSFAGIATMIPSASGSPSSREYVEGLYYRAHASMMSRLASNALHHLRVLISDDL